jgi:hypothetical protein
MAALYIKEKNDDKPSEKSVFLKSIEHLIKLSQKTNDEGEYFPVWAEGLGMEALVQLVAETNKNESNISAINHSKPLKFLKIASLSRLYSRMPEFLRTYLENNNGVYFNTKHGYTVKHFQETSALKSYFDVLSYS